MPLVKCQYCGKNFRRSSAWLRKTKHTFCSRQCFKLYMRDHPNEFVNTSHSPQFNKLLELARIREQILNRGD